MDAYGLTEPEERAGMQRYNHALFENMMFFMDISWEIRVAEMMVSVIADRTYPERDGHAFAYAAFLEMWSEECVAEADRAAVRAALSPGRLRSLREETTFDAHLNELGEAMRFRFVLTPSLDAQGKCTLVYLGARNMAEERKRLAAEETARRRLEGAALQAAAEQISREQLTLLWDALLVCTVEPDTDLIAGELEERIGEQRYPLLASLGLSAPCSFDLFSERWCDRCIPDAARSAFLRLWSRKALRAAWDSGDKRIESEFEATLADGSQAVLRGTAVLRQDPESTALRALIVVRDVTRKSRAQQRRRELLRQTHEALRTALETAGRASARAEAVHAVHESHASAEGDRTADALARISAQARHLLELVGEIAGVTLPDDGTLALESEPFSLPELLMRCEDEWLPRMREARVTGIFRAAPLPCETVLGDGARLQQLIGILLRASLRFTPEGGTISLTLSAAAPAEGEPLRPVFIVRDTGTGIPPERLPTLFEPAGRTHETPEDLGLPLVRTLARAMGGDVSVVSEPGAGTTFNVTLALSPLPVEEAGPDARLRGRPVLVVEADPIAGDAVQTLLTDLGTAPELVTTGAAAIALSMADTDRAKGDFLAVLLSDAEPDCPALVKRLRRLLGAQLPVLLTTQGREEALDPALRAAVTAVLRRPVFRSALAGALTALADAQAEPLPETLPEVRYDGLRALLVEDNELNAEIALSLLAETGLDVTCAANGREALDCIDPAEPFDVVFLDLKMPLMDGRETARALRALPLLWAQTVPLIAMSLNPTAEETREVLSAGCREMLAKPLDECKIRGALRRSLPQALTEQGADDTMKNRTTL